MALNQYFMLPGPTQIPPQILRAGSAPMVNHRGPEFAKIFQEISENLKKIFQTKNEVLTLTSSGTGALEAGIINFTCKGDKVIVASIGNFGERFKQIAEIYDLDVIFLDYKWGEAINPQDIKDILDKDSNHQIKALFFQHNETSTGIYNPVKEIIEACGNHPVLKVVDSVSGLLACPLETDEWGIDVVLAGSQKAFMVPPGLAFVCANEKAWKIQAKSNQPKFYFDLLKAKKSYQKNQTPYTPAVSLFYAVHEALNMIEDELGGVDNIINTHMLRRDAVRAAVRALNLNCVADDSCASPAVTAIYVPDGMVPAQIVKPLREKYNIVVAGGQGIFKEKIFRIGHLGYMNDLDIIATIAGLEMVLVELGHNFKLGSGVAAAQEALLKKNN